MPELAETPLKHVIQALADIPGEHCICPSVGFTPADVLSLLATFHTTLKSQSPSVEFLPGGLVQIEDESPTGVQLTVLVLRSGDWTSTGIISVPEQRS